MIILVLIFLFFYITASKVLAGQNLSWRSFSDVEKGIKMYFSWIGSVAGNFKSLTGHAVNMNWENQNKTSETKLKPSGKG